MGKLSLLRTTLGIIVNQRIDVARLIYEAHRLGIKVMAYTQGNNLAIRNADVTVIGQLNDKTKLKEFATQCQVVIYMNGSRISKDLVAYLRQYTNVPQGFNSLDLVNDRSIQRVFLNTINVNSLPYDTVFSIGDVKQALNHFRGPVLLRPVQTSYFLQRDVIITSPNQLSSYKTMFNGGAYLVESIPAHSRYFEVTVIKSRSSTWTLPIIEKHYHGQEFNFANEIDGNKESLKSVEPIKSNSLRIANHVDYVGALTISFILTADDQVYVDSIDSPFNFVNNVYNLTSNNIYQTFLRSIFGLSISLDKSRSGWLIEAVNKENLAQLEKLWINNQSVKLNLSSLLNKTSRNGYVLTSTNVLNNDKSKFHQE